MASLSPFAADWPLIDGLLDEAFELPATARSAWLDALGGERAVHRDALRRLLDLQAAIETDDFLVSLPSVAVPALAEPAGSPAPGDAVGAYRLVAPIGHGGMGTVWLAERADGLMARRVALKLPRAVWGDVFAERLARERVLLATLEHEHIARLYDAGIDAQGRPFLAMEYVEGVALDVWCETRQPSTHERVALLLQVMAAVGHAHSRLVVHRDLKPGNVLVGADAKVKLLDFGIAKLLEGASTRRTALTESTGRALTLDYASPEQIRGEPLGTQSDVYSLAVVACEILAGARPYRLKRGSVAELEEAIEAAEVPRASELATDPVARRALRGDLDAILNKALKKRIEDRYPTMEAFAADLRRWRDGEPVQARPDALGYRFAKFVRRHRLRVAAGAVAVAALATGTSVALWQAREARRAAAEARTEAATATAVQGFIESVFSANSAHQADPARARAATAHQLLDRGAERIDQDLAAAPAAQLRLYDVLAEMYVHMALNDRALALQEKSLALATRLHGPASLEALGRSVAVAKTLGEAGRDDEALALLLRADAGLRAGGDERVRMDVDSNLAALYLRRDPAKALERARRAAAIARRQPPSAGSVNSLHMLGETAIANGLPAEARDALLDASARIERVPGETAGALPGVLTALGEVQEQLGDLAAAAATLTRAQALAQKVSDPFTLHVAGFRLSRFQFENGRIADAVATARAGAAWARSLGRDPEFGSVPASLIGQYGRALLAWGDAAQALAVIDEACAAAPPTARDVLAPLLAVRADALLALGRTGEAVTDIAQATALLDGLPRRLTEVVPTVRRRVLAATGHADRALTELAVAPGPAGESALTAVALLRRHAERARLLLAAGRTEAAREAATAVLADIERQPARAFVRDDEAQAAGVLGQALLREARVAEALPVLRRALALETAGHDAATSVAVHQARAALAEAER